MQVGFGILCTLIIVMVLVMRKRLRKRRKFRARDRVAANSNLVVEQNSCAQESYAELEQEIAAAKPTPVTGRHITIYLMANAGESFAGYELLQSLLANGLRFGHKQIFHSYIGEDVESGVRFSLASATKPGIFELSSIGSFKSEALVLFMAEGITSFDKAALQSMLDVASELANDFDAQIWGPAKRALTASDRAKLFVSLESQPEVVGV